MTIVERELEIRSLLGAISQRWYLVVVFGLLGALIGYGNSLKNQDVYEATAVMSIGLNFDQPVPYYQYEEDLALGKVAGVVSSDDVLEAAINAFNQQLNIESDQLSVQEFRSKIRLERKGSRWEFIVSGQDSELAAAMADSWAEAAERALWEAYGHALRAKDLQLQLVNIQAELAELRADPTTGEEGVERIQALENITSDLDTRLPEELKLGRGLTTFVSFEWSQRAMVPNQPVTRTRGGQILAGNLLGIVIGSIVAFLSAMYSRQH